MLKYVGGDGGARSRSQGEWAKRRMSCASCLRRGVCAARQQGAMVEGWRIWFGLLPGRALGGVKVGWTRHAPRLDSSDA